MAAVAPREADADQADLALRRCQGYWLLSRLFAEVPNSERLAEALSALDELAGGSAGIQVEVAALRRELAAAIADPQAAAVAHTRYLTLVPHGSDERLPFESHFREGVLPGAATRQVEDFMIGAGYQNLALEVASVDHLAAELRLMAFFCHAEYTAWRDADRDGAVTSLARQQEFLQKHLAAWAPEYCFALAGHASHGYIRAIARLAAQTIDYDASELAAICASARRVAAGE